MSFEFFFFFVKIKSKISETKGKTFERLDRISSFRRTINQEKQRNQGQNQMIKTKNQSQNYEIQAIN